MDKEINKELLESYIKDIEWQILYYVKTDEVGSKLREDPEYTASLIKMNCEIILKNKGKNCKKYIDIIESLVINDVSLIEKESRLREMPDFIAKVIIEHCDEIISLYETKTSGLQDISNKFENKWIYIEWCEDGSVAIRINRLYFKDNKIVFDGDMIEFATVNTEYDGDGVLFFKDVEGYDITKLRDCDDIEDVESCDEILSKFEIKTNQEIKNIIYGSINYSIEDFNL